MRLRKEKYAEKEKHPQIGSIVLLLASRLLFILFNFYYLFIFTLIVFILFYLYLTSKEMTDNLTIQWKWRTNSITKLEGLDTCPIDFISLEAYMSAKVKDLIVTLYFHLELIHWKLFLKVEFNLKSTSSITFIFNSCGKGA